MTAVNWMPKKIKNYKSKYNNPKSTYISISIQHIDIIEFSCTISQENILVNKYSIILKNITT
jgi:hypothetical protein